MRAPEICKNLRGLLSLSYIFSSVEISVANAEWKC